MNILPAPANEHQFGGSHYKGVAYQHWDFAADCRLGYFEGQITKYISRYKKKNGLVDVQKCGHFLDKLIELAAAGRRPQNDDYTVGRGTRFIETNDLGSLEAIVVRYTASWERPHQLGFARVQVTRLIEILSAPKPDQAPRALTSEQEAAVDDTAGLAPKGDAS